MSFLVTAEGTVKNPAVTISSGDAELDSAALVCVLGWLYQPAVQDGKAIEVPYQAQIVWKLTDPPPITNGPGDIGGEGARN
jgi:TonB family protein